MVFVLDQNKTPLAPCHPAKARRLLKSGDAAIYRKQPFTIILYKEVLTLSEDCFRIKIDYGSRHTGLAILKNENVVWLGQIDHRTCIKENIDKRRLYRRRRRNTNLRYRKIRSSNRRRCVGWLPPSLQSRVDNIKHIVNLLCRLIPIGFISYENVKFDTQIIHNPEICGLEYQFGELFGYEIREYLLEKFNRTCVYCGKSCLPLEIEHVIPKSRGGSNRVSNLTISCHACNIAKGTKTAEEFGYPEIQKQCLKPLRDAAIVTSTRWAVYKVLIARGIDVECGSGAITKYNRIKLNIQKDHCFDAICVGLSTPAKVFIKTHTIHVIKASGRGQHRRTNVTKFGFPNGYFARHKYFFGFQTGDIVRANVPKGRNIGVHIGRVLCRKSGAFDVVTKSGRKQGISHKYFSIIQRQDGYCYCDIPIYSQTATD